MTDDPTAPPRPTSTAPGEDAPLEDSGDPELEPGEELRRTMTISWTQG